MNRLRAAWAALRGRPVVVNAVLDGPLRYASDNRRGGVIYGNTIRH